jgi:hypothetical protein
VLVGSADPGELAAAAPTLRGFDTAPLRLEGVETLQVLFEIESAGMESLLPPALHPTLPPVVTWLVQRVPESPWGPFRLAQCRVGCRSGLRPRGFLRAGIADDERAAAELAARWGYALSPGEVALERSYDQVRATARLAGRDVLEVVLRDPQPLRPEDVFVVASVHLAHTPRGLRLVQVDASHEPVRAERGQPLLHRFDAAAWRSPAIRPAHPVSAFFTVGAVTLPALRYASRPDVLAFAGTERVGGAA